ncbi:MAG: hypothetical protein FWG52_01320 [Proteobacteria bacterium]|nr:hypothetical protein [Pseudomonadota bacterium]
MPARFSFPIFHSLSRRILSVGACLAITAFPLGTVAADENLPNSAERIRQLQNEAEGLRKQAETHYQAAEAACYKRFFVNSCIDDAKAEHLVTIRRARELEAEAYQIDLAERRSKAAETAKKANGARPTEAASPSADQDAAKPRPEMAKLPRRAIKPNTASNSASERAKAARRAEAARRDRERYDARIRELEEKKARDEDGR